MTFETDSKVPTCPASVSLAAITVYILNLEQAVKVTHLSPAEVCLNPA
jgi:hypothetical protein